MNRCKVYSMNVEGTRTKCNQPATLIVDEEAPSIIVRVPHGSGDYVRMSRPVTRGDLCYYHTKKKQGLFDTVPESEKWKGKKGLSYNPLQELEAMFNF